MQLLSEEAHKLMMIFMRGDNLVNRSGNNIFGDQSFIEENVWFVTQVTTLKSRFAAFLCIFHYDLKIFWVLNKNTI